MPKKGWFSRNTQGAPNASTSTPYPPSINSVGQTQKPDQQAGGDGDLSPREVNAPEASTPTTHIQKPNDVADDAASELPPRAGFDLAAMRAAVEDIKDTSQSPRDVSGFHRLEIAPPFSPQGTITGNPLSASSPVISSPELTPISEYPSGIHIAATSGSRDIESTSSRSPSLDETRDAGAFGDEDATGDADEDHALSSPSSSTLPSRSPFSADSTPPFKGDYKPSWRPGVAEKDIFGGFGTSVGNSFHSTPFAAVDSTTMTALPPNASRADPAVSVAGRDPWSFPGYSGDVSASTSVKKPSMFAAANPWES